MKIEELLEHKIFQDKDLVVKVINTDRFGVYNDESNAEKNMKISDVEKNYKGFKCEYLGKDENLHYIQIISPICIIEAMDR